MSQQKKNRSKSSPDPAFWSNLQSESSPNAKKFVIVWIQSNAYLCYGSQLLVS